MSDNLISNSNLNLMPKLKHQQKVIENIKKEEKVKIQARIYGFDTMDA